MGNHGKGSRFSPLYLPSIGYNGCNLGQYPAPAVPAVVEKRCMEEDRVRGVVPCIEQRKAKGIEMKLGKNKLVLGGIIHGYARNCKQGR